jgi:FkbM family methyltransferase
MTLSCSSFPLQAPSGTGVENFKRATSFWSHRKEKIKHSIFKKITKNALPLFTRGGDIISINPWVNGHYENEINHLVHFLSNKGYSHFLLDIGANIGLSSCQFGKNFQEIHLFEPNPQAISILKINTQIALHGKSYFIHEYGLGSKKEMLHLSVPPNNWGGAFIASADNAYQPRLLASKDGYSQFDQNNYDEIAVQIESASEKLGVIFEKMVQKNLTHGVIKIDVEGYEKFIIETILTHAPASLSFFIIFENWKSGMELRNLENKGHMENRDPVSKPLHSTHLYRLHTHKKSWAFAPRWFNSLCHALAGRFQTTLQAASRLDQAGTYVLEVGGQSAL